jgi:hypothetical protein
VRNSYLDQDTQSYANEVLRLEGSTGPVTKKEILQPLLPSSATSHVALGSIDNRLASCVGQNRAAERSQSFGNNLLQI